MSRRDDLTPQAHPIHDDLAETDAVRRAEPRRQKGTDSIPLDKLPRFSIPGFMLVSMAIMLFGAGSSFAVSMYKFRDVVSSVATLSAENAQLRSSIEANEQEAHSDIAGLRTDIEVLKARLQDLSHQPFRSPPIPKESIP